jgi:hypothetical protein
MKWKGTGRAIVVSLFLVTILDYRVNAQTHPCDQPAPATVTVQSGAPHKVQFCSPAGDGVEAVLATVDAVPTDLVPVTAKTTASATGLVLFETTLFLQVSRGAHTLTIASYNTNAITGALQLGPASSPFAFTAVDDTPLPTAPSLRGVVR